MIKIFIYCLVVSVLPAFADSSLPAQESQQVEATASQESSSLTESDTSAATPETINESVQASAPTSSSQPETKTNVIEDVSTKNDATVKPNAGSISEVAKMLNFIVTTVFLIGLFKPAWILRWHTAPSKKMLLVYYLPITVLLSSMSEYTKSPEAKASEQKAKIEKQVQHDEIIAKQKETPKSNNTVQKDASVPKPQQTRMQLANARFASYNQKLSNSSMANDPRCQSALTDVLHEIEFTVQKSKELRAQYAIDKVQSPHLLDGDLNQYNYIMDAQAMKAEGLLDIVSTVCRVY